MVNKTFDFQTSELRFLPKIFFPHVIFLDCFRQFKQSFSSKEPLILISKNVLEHHKQLLVEAGLKKKNMCIVPSEPYSQEKEKCLDFARTLKKSPNIILAIGGGSVIDIAKLVKRELKLTLVVIPTTPNTGAEVTPYAVVVNEQGHKVVANDSAFLPDVVILDTVFLSTLTKAQVGPMLIDIYSHAVESFFSRFSNTLTETLAVSCMEILNQCLNEKKLSSHFWKKVQMAGFLGGLCQASSGTGMAHALAHYFGPQLKISHGVAISLFLSETIKLNVKNTTIKERMNHNHLSKKYLLRILEKIIKKTSYKVPQMRWDQKWDREEAEKALLRDVCMLTNPVRPTSVQLHQMFDILQ